MVDRYEATMFRFHELVTDGRIRQHRAALAESSEEFLRDNNELLKLLSRDEEQKWREIRYALAKTARDTSYFWSIEELFEATWREFFEWRGGASTTPS